jgi:hypothetical protein
MDVFANVTVPAEGRPDMDTQQVSKRSDYYLGIFSNESLIWTRQDVHTFYVKFPVLTNIDEPRSRSELHLNCLYITNKRI